MLVPEYRHIDLFIKVRCLEKNQDLTDMAETILVNQM